MGLWGIFGITFCIYLNQYFFKKELFLNFLAEFFLCYTLQATTPQLDFIENETANFVLNYSTKILICVNLSQNESKCEKVAHLKKLNNFLSY